MQARVLNANLIQSLRQKQLFTKDDHVLVAVSGGEDSLNLLHWLTKGQLPMDLQPKVSAAYINHQLRDDAAVEERFVRQVFEHTPNLVQTKVKQIQWAKKPEVGLEELAREERYAALTAIANEVGANILMTAHHQDDQAETILYKLIRGGRLSQLQGMQESLTLTDKLQLIRPFLGLSKESIRTLNNHDVVEWVQDVSNEDVSFARNRIRHVILPEMTEVNHQATQHVIALSEQLLGQEALLQPVLDNYVQQVQAGLFDWQLPMVSCVLVLQHWLADLAKFDVSDKQLMQVVHLMRNDSVNRGEVMLRHGRRFVRSGSYLAIEGL